MPLLHYCRGMVTISMIWFSTLPLTTWTPRTCVSDSLSSTATWHSTPSFPLNVIKLEELGLFSSQYNCSLDFERSRTLPPHWPSALATSVHCSTLWHLVEWCLNKLALSISKSKSWLLTSGKERDHAPALSAWWQWRESTTSNYWVCTICLHYYNMVAQ